ncbi:MAG: 2-amino-4-hydroxy-6-hydroxymethyldihydropteridine diphosphokinase [Gammaproteobacteria bacterium]|nr:2-amino-4-hydroxy-6-hydroxymethyldihydropteridine diphosphokinase [Gammaproteobacteria bacterium]MBT4608100.1 2-amino-4-hydroxy-6-hydroxymethyldihydropteridine diphosphokinase [Thiotrichales bacterium]MBT3471993.1 2-amino-4-hydroxy-6-hydroxymethyldihydropteridine diphosphokinase [Gammaproteobacteria bacterium]MBT3968219.1 2-amino-4-hydroxy-6-hydroxymethyldihydropteridine diphosphokinase [Gammaproteobacteria bacterium]MBT4080473.1 2-amino-4-hydroxy-6-hydroxymethyldihydropteridine diphosphokin
MRAVVGLGSNLQQPERQLRQALDALRAIAEEGVVKASSLYRSPPMGPQDQPDYINAVAVIETVLEPLELLDQLQQIEQQQGRERKRHWGERTLDLDLLLYGDQSIDHPRLQVPHPGITERSFVLLPMQEVLGDMQEIPGQGELGQWVERCNCDEIERVVE